MQAKVTSRRAKSAKRICEKGLRLPMRPSESSSPVVSGTAPRALLRPDCGHWCLVPHYFFRTQGAQGGAGTVAHMEAAHVLLWKGVCTEGRQVCGMHWCS